VDDYAGCVLVIETSEEMPSAEEVHRMLRNAGERGLLAQFPAIVLGKPKAWDRDKNQSEAERSTFRADQYESVLRAISDYHPSAMLVCGPDLGHTDPQYVIPFGGLMTVDGPARRISVTY
jgi:muramoyltetrapeptide carboxypeptidase LdcA involved in peptidoglycan recycling